MEASEALNICHTAVVKFATMQSKMRFSPQAAMDEWTQYIGNVEADHPSELRTTNHGIAVTEVLSILSRQLLDFSTTSPTHSVGVISVTPRDGDLLTPSRGSSNRLGELRGLPRRSEVVSPSDYEKENSAGLQLIVQEVTVPHKQPCRPLGDCSLSPRAQSIETGDGRAPVEVCLDGGLTEIECTGFRLE